MKILSDPNVWRNVDLFYDGDGDGYEDGSGPASFCIGNDIPSQYIEF